MKLKSISSAIFTFIIVYNLLNLFFNSYEKVMKETFYHILVGVAVVLIFYFIDNKKMKS